MLHLCESTKLNPQRKGYFLIVATPGCWLIPSPGGSECIMLPKRSEEITPPHRGEHFWYHPWMERKQRSIGSAHTEKAQKVILDFGCWKTWVSTILGIYLYQRDISPLPVNCAPCGLNIWLLGTTASPSLNTCKRLPITSKLAVPPIYHLHGSLGGSFSFWACSVGPAPGACGINASYTSREQPLKKPSVLSHHKSPAKTRILVPHAQTLPLPCARSHPWD